MGRLTFKNDIGHYALKTVLNAELGVHLGSKVSPVFDAIDRLGEFEDKLERGELVEVVHGEWDYKTYDSAGNTLYRCSNCKNYAREKTYHCPDCGAIMDGKEQP